MKKRLALILSVFGLIAVFTLSSASVASADTLAPANTVTFGACMSSISTSLKPYQAPGQSGNGPLTIVNGNIIRPTAFDGAVGCLR